MSFGKSYPQEVTRGNAAGSRTNFGVSWQIVPTALGKLMGDPHPEKSRRVMQAMLKMQKIDIKTLQQAYEES